jgi:hypothetical protein
MRFLRRLVPPPQPPAISIEDAEAIARREAVRRGWEWKEPVRRKLEGRRYVFWTNTSVVGGNVSAQVNADDGEIIHIGVTKR